MVRGGLLAAKRIISRYQRAGIQPKRASNNVYDYNPSYIPPGRSGQPQYTKGQSFGGGAGRASLEQPQPSLGNPELMNIPEPMNWAVEEYLKSLGWQSWSTTQFRKTKRLLRWVNAIKDRTGPYAGKENDPKYVFDQALRYIADTALKPLQIPVQLIENMGDVRFRGDMRPRRGRGFWNNVRDRVITRALPDDRWIPLPDWPDSGQSDQKQFKRGSCKEFNEILQAWIPCEENEKIQKAFANIKSKAQFRNRQYSYPYFSRKYYRNSYYARRRRYSKSNRYYNRNYRRYYR